MTLSPYDQTRLRNWRVAHLPAALDALFIGFAVIVNFSNPVAPALSSKLLASPLIVGIFWFLGWMIYDLNRPRNRPFDEKS